MTTVQELPTNPIPPFPFFVENAVELNHPDLPTDKVNSIPNPIPNPSYVSIDNNPLPDRCQFTFSDGRQCTMARSDIHPSLCRFHAEREEQLFGDPAPGGNVVGRALDLPELYSACRDLTTAAGVNRALGQVFRLLAQRRISRQEAATFGHLAQLLFRTISAMRSSPESPATNVDPISPASCPASNLRLSEEAVAAIPDSRQEQTIESNPRTMNTCAKVASNSRSMSTYQNAGLKPVHNEHLQMPQGATAANVYPPAAKVYPFAANVSPPQKGSPQEALFAGDKVELRGANKVELSPQNKVELRGVSVVSRAAESYDAAH